MRHLIGLVVMACCLAGCAGAPAPLALVGRAIVVEKITPVLDQAAITYHVRRAQQAPVIDGQADEWKDVPAMVLDKKEQSGGKWDGPEDLSGSLRLMWDEQALYFCLQVKDNVHAAPNAEKDFWENDCSQFAFDAYMNGPSGGYDADELSYAVSDSPSGPLMAGYRWAGLRREQEGLIKKQVVRMTVEGDGTRLYEWAMGWPMLDPVSPFLLGRCAFCRTLNDNDGSGFKGGLFWTKGVVWGQDASKFGQIVFDGAQGTRPAALGLRPECKVISAGTSQWIETAGLDPWATARLLVLAPEGASVEARVSIYGAGEKEPVAVGEVRHRIEPNRPTVFAWELGELPDGKYELAYGVSGISPASERRLGFYHSSIDRLLARKAELRDRFGIDRPWDDMADAPEVIRRHRGMVALLLEMLDCRDWTQRLGSSYTTDPDEVQWGMLADFTAMMNALDAGKDFLGRQRGILWCAYYSPADGSGQPFVATVPNDFSRARTYPLCVSLHGRGGRPLPKRDAAYNEQYIGVSPWGRGDNGFRALGENDVLEIIRYVREWYKIDPARIYVAGGSMGGWGTWHMASGHPDLFAAGAAVAGYPAGLPLENLKHVPVFNQHGGKDWTVPIDYSRFAVSMLQKMGYAVMHKEFPDGTHESFAPLSAYPTAEWMLTLRRPGQPAAVTYTCQSPDQGKAYWLNIRRFVDPHARAEVNACATGYGGHQALSLALDNVEVLELDTAAMPVDRNSKLLVQVGFDLLEQEAPLPERLFVLVQDKGWTLAREWSPPASETRPYRAGAAAELYTGEPLLVVYGSQGDDGRDAILRTAAEDLARFPGEGGDMPIGRFSIKADRDVTGEDMEHFNLVLIGGARDNSVVARMADRLPFTINNKNELVAGDRDPVSLAGAGIRLGYYNPLSPKRLIFLTATEETGEAADKWLRNVRELMTGSSGENRVDQPDLVVQSLDGPPRRLMQFTHGWQWRQLPGADVKAPEAMASSRAMTLARLRVLRRTAGADFSFGWGAKAEEKEFDPSWFTRADMATAGSPSQTLLCTMSGEELIDIYKRWVEKGEMTVVPHYKPEAIDPKRDYRVAMPPWLCGDLASGRKKNLRDVEAGPEWRQEDLWKEIFGE